MVAHSSWHHKRTTPLTDGVHPTNTDRSPERSHPLSAMSLSFSGRSANILAALLLTTSLFLAAASVRGDAAIVDEIAHLPAGYSYVTRGDMRLNPEHPPLLKDLAGLSLLMWSKLAHQTIVFPDWLKSWTTETNGQWSFGPDFLYRFNRLPETMLWWGRLPTLLLLPFFGLFLYSWTKRRWGHPTALLTLFFYALSPTVIAHGRYVTTDLAATAAFFVSTVVFLRWLERPTGKNLLLAGLALGLAELTKFSLILLLPVFGLLVLLKPLLPLGANATQPTGRLLLRSVRGYLAVLLIAYGLVVTPVYAFHTINYPVARQQSDLEANRPILDTSGPLASFAYWSADKPVLRGLGYYLTGVLLVRNRSLYGSLTFFLGKVDNVGRVNYFPVVYLLKEPLAFHLLTLTSIALAVGWIVLKLRARFDWHGWWAGALPLLTFLLIVASYWIFSMRSALNIGVRHVLPTFPFIAVLVSRQLVLAGERLRKDAPRGFLAAAAVLGLLLVWQFFSVVKTYPSFLAYFNELAGGPSGGHRYVVDSNLDWGQDLNRLATFVKQRGIQTIYLDYFGRGDIAGQLGGIAREYHVEDGPVKGWLAISETYLENERGQPGKNIVKEPNRYAWLESFEPVATIGYSLVVYFIP